MRLKTDNVCGFLLIHTLAALALLPWFFSWSGVALFIAGFFACGLLGINLCYHRLLTHRSLSAPRWFEHLLATLATCSAQDSPPHWIAVHRRHHQNADAERDPHSPHPSFFWAHMGWLLVKREDMARGPLIARYAPDIAADPYYAWLDRHSNWIKVALSSWLAYFAAGFALAAARGGGAGAAAQLGLSWLIWGAILRTVVVWHVTWSVNSVTHVWGSRRYDTPDRSRNNALIGLLASGEGWHNNHHADPRAARHGRRWYELDLTWLVLRALAALGLARDVVAPLPLDTAGGGRGHG